MVSINRCVVTGSGGDIGFNIGRILKDINPSVELIGLDCRELHAGRGLSDVSYTVDLARSEKYLPQISKILADHKPEVFIPTSEAEIDVLSRHPEVLANVVTLILSRAVLNVGLDKFETFKFLAQNDLPAPMTFLANNFSEEIFPAILKPRSGHGSKFIQKVDGESDLRKYSVNLEQYVLQKFLPTADEEYTCGLYRSSKGEVRSIVLKRKLTGGFTGEGIVVENDTISKLLSDIAININLVGAINVQLRLENEIPYVFEINPRFSSTVMFRHLMGYKDLLWSIQDAFGEPIGEYSPPKAGTAFFRVSSEIII